MTAELAGMRQEMTSEFASMRKEMTSELINIRKEMHTELTGIRKEITALKKWVIGAMVAMTGIFAAIVKVF